MGLEPLLAVLRQRRAVCAALLLGLGPPRPAGREQSLCAMAPSSLAPRVRSQCENEPSTGPRPLPSFPSPPPHACPTAPARVLSGPPPTTQGPVCSGSNSTCATSPLCDPVKGILFFTFLLCKIGIKIRSRRVGDHLTENADCGESCPARSERPSF